MLLPAVIAAIAAISTVSAQDVTAVATECSTRYGYYPLPTGSSGSAAVPTYSRAVTNIRTFSVVYTTRDVITATPDATTFVDVQTTTTTVFTTTTSTPVPVTVATPAGFVPMMGMGQPGPTAASRIKRRIGGRDAHDLSVFKRQTAANHTGGYIVDRNGNGTTFNRKYVRRIDCTVTYNVDRTVVTVVTGLPETVFVAPATATSLSTITFSTTQTVTAIAPRETVYQACQANNVVNWIWDFNGKQMWFNRIVYRPVQGFPVENELVVTKETGKDCCIACQTTPNCAGSFLVPSKNECHLRLTQPPSSAIPALPVVSTAAPTLPSGAPIASFNGDFNETWPLYPNATIVTPSGVVAMPYPISTAPATGLQNSNTTCALGSMSLYLGTVQGEEDFPSDVAMYMSNGGCGRMSVWPIPLDDDENYPGWDDLL